MPVLTNSKHRFVLVGITNTAIDFSLLLLLRSLGAPVEVANIISTTTAFLFSFTANKKYTFKSHDGSLIREMILFTVVTLFGLWVLQTTFIAMTLPGLTALVNSQTIGLIAAKLFASVITLVWNYVMYSRVVFIKKRMEQ